MKESIESGTEWIEDPVDLNLIIDELDFEDIEDISVEKLENQKVYDLEIENQHNYLVDGLGIVHNGGGKK
jgi:intein/homing endonuclease